MLRRAAALALALVIGGLLASACVETVRCPEGQIFDERGECVEIPDAGPDAS